MEGFFRHRWGDHAVRSLGLALALWEETSETSGILMTSCRRIRSLFLYSVNPNYIM